MEQGVREPNPARTNCAASAGTLERLGNHVTSRDAGPHPFCLKHGRDSADPVPIGRRPHPGDRLLHPNPEGEVKGVARRHADLSAVHWDEPIPAEHPVCSDEVLVPDKHLKRRPRTRGLVGPEPASEHRPPGPLASEASSRLGQAERHDRPDHDVRQLEIRADVNPGNSADYWEHRDCAVRGCCDRHPPQASTPLELTQQPDHLSNAAGPPLVRHGPHSGCSPTSFALASCTAGGRWDLASIQYPAHNGSMRATPSATSQRERPEGVEAL